MKILCTAFRFAFSLYTKITIIIKKTLASLSDLPYPFAPCCCTCFCKSIIKKYHGNKETSKSACIYVIYYFFGMLMVHLIEYLGSQTHSLFFFEHFLCVSIFNVQFFLTRPSKVTHSNYAQFTHQNYA